MAKFAKFGPGSRGLPDGAQRPNTRPVERKEAANGLGLTGGVEIERPALLGPQRHLLDRKAGEAGVPVFPLALAPTGNGSEMRFGAARRSHQSGSSSER